MPSRPTPSGPGRASRPSGATRVPELDRTVAPRDARHAYAVLSGLTSAGGGMVAAATTSLPERARQGRNYDYRFVWIRDQCYAGQAVAKAGPHPLDGRCGALRLGTPAGGRAAASSPPTRPPAVRVPDQRTLELAGLSRVARTSSATGSTEQFQLDAFGEALLLFAAAAASRPPRQRRLARGGDGGRGDRAALARAGHRCRDLGDRARRVDAQPADLRRRVARDRRARAREASRPPAGSRWPTRSSPTPRRTRFTAPGAGSARPVTRAPTRRCCSQRSAAPFPASDPRSIATLQAIEAELTEDGYCYRYRPDERPLGAVRGRVPAVRVLDGSRLRPAGRSRGRRALVRAEPGRVRAAGPLLGGVRRPPAPAARQPSRRRSCTHCCSSAPSSSTHPPSGIRGAVATIPPSPPAARFGTPAGRRERRAGGCAADRARRAAAAASAHGESTLRAGRSRGSSVPATSCRRRSSHEPAPGAVCAQAPLSTPPTPSRMLILAASGPRRRRLALISAASASALAACAGREARCSG